MNATLHPWLTVIVAAYNVEKYIHQALASVLKQIDERVKVIVVNDGSTDNTLEEINRCIHDFPSRENCIEVITQTNAGVSEARNTGLKILDSPYVTFLDGDDYWLDNYYDKILSSLGEVDNLTVDIVEFNALAHREDKGNVTNEFLRFNALGNYRGQLTHEQFRKIVILSKWNPWARIYKSKLFEGMEFPKDRHYEDMMLLPLLYVKAHEIVAFEDAIIAYRINPASIMSNPSQSDVNDIEYNIEQHLAIAQSLEPEKRDIMILLACQSMLYYKMITNVRDGYIKSILPIKRLVKKIKPFAKQYDIELPFKTKLLFISPSASNMYTYLKMRKS